MGRRIIRMCEVRLVDRKPIDVGRGRVGVVVKIAGVIIQCRLQW